MIASKPKVINFVSFSGFLDGERAVALIRGRQTVLPVFRSDVLDGRSFQRLDHIISDPSMRPRILWGHNMATQISYVELPAPEEKNQYGYVIPGDPSIYLASLGRTLSVSKGTVFRSVFLTGYSRSAKIVKSVGEDARSVLAANMRKYYEFSHVTCNRGDFLWNLSCSYRDLSLAYQFGGVAQFGFILNCPQSIRKPYLDETDEYLSIEAFLSGKNDHLEHWAKGDIPFDTATSQVFFMLRNKLDSLKLFALNGHFDQAPDPLLRLIVLALNSPKREAEITICKNDYKDAEFYTQATLKLSLPDTKTSTLILEK